MDICSACLTGAKCRYDGEAREDAQMKARFEAREIKALCPECLAKLPIPRCPSEIVGGDGGDVLSGRARVLAQDGGDLTIEFIEGAQKFLEAARRCGAKRAYLKSKSPSCGCGRIYDGTFSGKLSSGDGVTAALLKRNGFEVIEV